MCPRLMTMARGVRVDLVALPDHAMAMLGRGCLRRAPLSQQVAGACAIFK